MSNESERQGYRDRLSEGDIVYFVEGDDILGSDDATLVVKKGTITSTRGPEGWKRFHPRIAIWNAVDEDPQQNNGYVGESKSPRELFKETELGRLLRDHDGPLGIDNRTIDELVVDPLSNTELAGLIGGATMSRLVEDEIRNPGNPEL